MASRTVRAGFIVYTGTDSRPLTGYLGDVVDVHEDDIERFDRLNPEAPNAEPTEESDADVVEFPEGDPTEEWTGKQLDAYAAVKGFDLGSAKNKAEKVAAIAAATASA